MTEPPRNRSLGRNPRRRAPETFSGGFVVPPRTCANCGRKFPSVMHLSCTTRPAAKKGGRGRPRFRPSDADAARAGAGVARLRRRRSTAASRGASRDAQEEGVVAVAAAVGEEGVVAHEAPWEACRPETRA